MEATIKLLAEAVGPSRPPAAATGPQCMDCDEPVPAAAAAASSIQQGAAHSSTPQDAQQATGTPAPPAAAAATLLAADQQQQAPPGSAAPAPGAAPPPAPPLSPAAAAFAAHLQTLFERPIREEEVQGPAAAAGPAPPPPDCPPDCPPPPTAEEDPAPGVDLLTVDLTKPQRARRGPTGSSSRFRGVTRHRRTRRWEAHIWDVKKQVYLGGFDDEHSAAKAHDLMALKCRGPGTLVNFDVTIYGALTPLLGSICKEELVHLLRSESKRKPRPPSAAAAGGGGLADTTSESDIELDDVTTGDDAGDTGDAGDVTPRPAPTRSRTPQKRAAARKRAAAAAAARGCGEPPVQGVAAAAAAAAVQPQQQGVSEPAVQMRGGGTKAGPSAAGPSSPPAPRRRAPSKQRRQQKHAAAGTAALGEALMPKPPLLAGPGAAPLSDEDPRPLSALLEHPMPPDVLAAILGGPISAIDRTLLTERLAATAAIAREGFGGPGLSAAAELAAAPARHHAHGGGAACVGAPAWAAAGGACGGGGGGGNVPAWSCGSGSSPASPLVTLPSRVDGGGGLFAANTSLPLPPTPTVRAPFAAAPPLSAPQAQLQHAWAAQLRGGSGLSPNGGGMGGGASGPVALNGWGYEGYHGPAGALPGSDAGPGRYLSGALPPQQQQQQQQQHQQQQQRFAGGGMPYAAQQQQQQQQQQHNHQTSYQQHLQQQYNHQASYQQCRYPVITSPAPTPQPRSNSNGNGGAGYGARPAPPASPQGRTLQGAASLVTSCSPQEQWELLRRSQQTLADRDSVSGAPLMTGANCHSSGGGGGGPAAPPSGAFSGSMPGQPPPALWHQRSAQLPAPCWGGGHQQAASAAAGARPATAPPAPQRGVLYGSAAVSADGRGGPLGPPPAAPTPSQAQPPPAAGGAAAAATASGSADSVAPAGRSPPMQPPARPVATPCRASMVSPFLTAQQECTAPPPSSNPTTAEEGPLQQEGQLQQGRLVTAADLYGVGAGGGQLLIGAAALGPAGSLGRSGSLPDVLAEADRMLDAASRPEEDAAAAAAKDSPSGGRGSPTAAAVRGGGSSSEPPAHQPTAHSGIPSPARLGLSVAAPPAAIGAGPASADAGAGSAPPSPAQLQQRRKRRVAWADCLGGGMGGGDGEESGTDEGWCPQLYEWPPAGAADGPAAAAAEGCQQFASAHQGW